MSEVAGNQLQEWLNRAFRLLLKVLRRGLLKNPTLSARDSLNTGYGPVCGPYHIGSYRIEESGCHFCTIPHILQERGRDCMRLRILALSVCLLGAVTAKAADNLKWQHGTLTATERQKVKEGSTITHNTDATAKDRGDKTDYSSSSTTTKSDNIETYQVYTIESGNIVYVGSEHLLFPWSKAADIDLGHTVQFAVKGDKMFILDASGKQHKATVVKTSLKSAAGASN